MIFSDCAVLPHMYLSHTFFINYCNCRLLTMWLLLIAKLPLKVFFCLGEGESTVKRKPQFSFFSMCVHAHSLFESPVSRKAQQIQLEKLIKFVSIPLSVAGFCFSGSSFILGILNCCIMPDHLRCLQEEWMFQKLSCFSSLGI